MDVGGLVDVQNGGALPLVRLLRRFLEIATFAGLPIVLLAAFTLSAPGDTYAWDFHAFWGAATSIVHGRSPYTVPGANGAGTPYPLYLYPPLLAELILPLGLLPFLAAAGIFVAASVGALVVALRLLGVTDWRCYGAAFLWLPVLHACRLGALTPLLVLGVAACWRFRHSRTMEPLLALVVTLKLFLWPVLVLVAVRRGRASARHLFAWCLVLLIGGWSLVGFSGIRSYPALIADSQKEWEADGYGVASLLHRIGVPLSVANVLLLLAAAIIIALASRLDERTAYAGAVVLACLVSPVSWMHYSALLLVPVALFQTRLGWAWIAPLALWLTPLEQADGNLARIGLWVTVAVSTLYCARRRPAERLC